MITLSILYSFFLVIIYSEEFVNLSFPNLLKFRYLKNSKLFEVPGSQGTSMPQYGFRSQI